MKILGTGLNGLVGSRITELLKDSFGFTNISRETGVDICNKDQVEDAISSSDAHVVFHLAAKTDVDGCENDRDLGKEGDAWRINVIGTQNVAEASKRHNKKLVYVSTDFVFDGVNPPVGGYSEEDAPHPLSWYGETKYEGEKVVQNEGGAWMILRIAYPYRAQFVKKDFFRAMKDRLEQNLPMKAVSDGLFTPTFIDDIAVAFKTLVLDNQQGIFHVTGNQALSPYDAAVSIAKVFNLRSDEIGKTTQEEFFKGRAERPFHGVIKNDKIQKLGLSMSTFREGLLRVKDQLGS